MGKIILVTGGASSGKSEFAEGLLESIKKQDEKPLYIATSRIFDEEMQEKKLKHIKRRQAFNWDCLEIHEGVGEFIRDKVFNRKILIDCVTMLITNIIFEFDKNFDGKDRTTSLKIKEEVELQIGEIIKVAREKDIDLILVTNEIGLSVVPENSLSRFFVKLSGEINNVLAKNSDEVYFVVSGIPMKIK